MDLYRQLTPRDRGLHVIGQIFHIPALCAMQDYLVLRTRKWDRNQRIAEATFAIEKASLKDIQGFVQPFDELPIPELNLQHKEDLLVQKVKRRPAVLVVREGYHMRRFSEWSANLGKKPNPTRHVFAPIVSFRKQGNLGRDYPEAFIGKVSAAEYPEYIYSFTYHLLNAYLQLIRWLY